MTNKFELAKATAEGRWEDYLEGKLGLDLNEGKPTACPLCGGEDRFTFDDKLGQGNWFCRGPKAVYGMRQPHYGDGIALASEYLTLASGQTVSPSAIASDILHHFRSEQPAEASTVAANREAKKLKRTAEKESKYQRVLGLIQQSRRSLKQAAKESPESPISIALMNHRYVKEKGLSELHLCAKEDTGTVVAGADTGHRGNPRCVAVEYVDLDADKLCGVELIAPDGTKRTTGRKGAHLLPYYAPADTALVVEGWATGVALNAILRSDPALASKFRVVVSGGCGASAKTAEQLKRRLSLQALVIHEDDGEGTPEGELSFPVFNGGNDCADWLNEAQPIEQLKALLRSRL